MFSNSASSLIFSPDKTRVPIGNPKPGAGGEKQQSQHSASGGMKRSRDSNQNSAAADLQAIRRHCTGPSQSSHFVFTSLKDAIREWNETRDSKAQNELSFNILATVRKWSNPKESKGVNSSIYVYRKLTCGLKDQIHMSRQRCCQMSAITPFMLLFSLTPKNAPKSLLLEKKFVFSVYNYNSGRVVSS